MSSLVTITLLLCALTFDTPFAPAAEPSPSTSNISADQFTASPFAEAFRNDDYQRALQLLAPILAQYPDDPLVLRYKAMTLDRLGLSDEAVAIYQDLLRRAPDHAPTHFFLGEAYERMGRREDAAKEWRWVQEHSPAPTYQQWAQERLARVGEAAVEPQRKRWALYANVGWDWDSNVPLTPSDKGVATVGDKNASRFSLDFGLRYRAISTPSTRLDVLYTARQSLHTDSMDDFNFTSQELGLDVRRRANVGGREVTFGGRYDFLIGFLEGDLFALTNRFTASAETRFTPQTRTIFSHRLAVSEFGPDGFDPSRTSRDGVYNDTALSQYWYTRDFRRHVFIREEFNAGAARGNNYDRVGVTTRVGGHTPLVWRTDLDASTGFQYSKYPHFLSTSNLDPERRRDTTWDTLISVTHHLTDSLDLRAQYRWVDALNRNDIFQYQRHVVGIHLLYTQAF